MVLRIALVLALIVVLAVGAVWMFGPREPADLTVTFDPASIGEDPDAYLARTEADIPNLRPGDGKEIVWAYPASHAKTPLAIVYIHGFSSSKEEVRPMPDEVARRLGANLFFTRLAGHGRDSAAMREASVNDWINDLAEAIAVGRRIGERVVVISSSTGATLATVGATVPGLMDGVAGLVMMSPNFALLDRYAFVLDMPYARTFGPWLAGASREFTVANPDQAEHWTIRYPTVALLPMGALVRAARRADIEAIAIPAFFLFSPADQIVDPQATEEVAARWRAPKSVLQVPKTGDAANHILAGRILSPATTDEIATRVADWIEALPKG